MSHFTTMTLQIKDKDVLLASLKEMGYRVEENSTIRGYQGSQTVDIAVRMSQGYDIGFVRNASGHYELIADWWGVRSTDSARFSHEVQSRVEEEIRRKVEELQRQVRQQYAEQCAVRELQRQNFKVVDRRVEPNGTIRILVRR